MRRSRHDDISVDGAMIHSRRGSPTILPDSWTGTKGTDNWVSSAAGVYFGGCAVCYHALAACQAFHDILYSKLAGLHCHCSLFALWLESKNAYWNDDMVFGTSRLEVVWELLVCCFVQHMLLHTNRRKNIMIPCYKTIDQILFLLTIWTTDPQKKTIWTTGQWPKFANDLDDQSYGIGTRAYYLSSTSGTA
jgi:hypothetical protein